MGLLSGMDEFERYLEGLFRDRLCGRVSPLEIGRRLCREMKEARRVSVLRIYVPGMFTVRLNSSDFAALGGCLTHLSRELAIFLKEKASKYGYTMVVPPSVTFCESADLPCGAIGVEAFFENDHTADRCENTRCFERIKDASFPAPKGKDGARLMVLAGPDQARTVTLNGACVVLGRQSFCDFILSDPSVSRRHASIEYDSGGYLLMDLNSTNGTYVNGVKARKKVLKDGDTITLGNTVMLITYLHG